MRVSVGFARSCQVIVQGSWFECQNYCKLHPECKAALKELNDNIFVFYAVRWDTKTTAVLLLLLLLLLLPLLLLFANAANAAGAVVAIADGAAADSTVLRARTERDPMYE